MKKEVHTKIHGKMQNSEDGKLKASQEHDNLPTNYHELDLNQASFSIADAIAYKAVFIKFRGQTVNLSLNLTYIAKLSIDAKSKIKTLLNITIHKFL